jgi:hypothetical protein
MPSVSVDVQETPMVEPTEKPHPKGHRQRLRDRFLSEEASALTEESLIELLLTFAIPQKDVRPLAVCTSYPHRRPTMASVFSV